MTRDEFKQLVISEVSEGGQLPLRIPAVRFDTIIDQALRNFWKKDDEAVEFEYAILPVGVFHTELFKQRRQVRMPDCTNAVVQVQMTGSAIGRTMEIDADFRKLAYNPIGGGMGGAGSDSDVMLYSIVGAYYQDYLRQFYNRTVSYEFSDASHMLTIKGKDPIQTMIAHCYMNLPEESMFNNPRFLDYVKGTIWAGLARIIGFAGMKLLGGYEINYADLKEDGKELIEKVEKEWEEQRDSADFFDEF